MSLTREDLLAIGQLLDGKLKAELSPIRKDLKSAKTDLGSVKTDLGVFKRDLESIKIEQARINIIIENEIRRDIKILAENYLPAAKRYEKATETIEAMKNEIIIMRKAITRHSEKLVMIS